MATDFNSLNIVVYTAVSGSGLSIYPSSWTAPNIKYICFTDQQKSSQIFCNWELKPLDPIGNNKCRNAKIYKLFPNKFLPPHDISIWIDSNLLIHTGYTKLIYNYIDQYDMILFKHPERNCLYHEAQVCLRGLHQNEPGYIDKITNQIERYKKLGFPANFGLTENNIIIRKSNLLVQDFMLFWWNEIVKGSQRDQLSLMFSYWYFAKILKKEIKIKFLEETPRDNTYHTYMPKVKTYYSFFD